MYQRQMRTVILHEYIQNAFWNAHEMISWELLDPLQTVNINLFHTDQLRILANVLKSKRLH